MDTGLDKAYELAYELGWEPDETGLSVWEFFAGLAGQRDSMIDLLDRTFALCKVTMDSLDKALEERDASRKEARELKIPLAPGECSELFETLLRSARIEEWKDYAGYPVVDPRGHQENVVISTLRTKIKALEQENAILKARDTREKIPVVINQRDLPVDSFRY